MTILIMKYLSPGINFRQDLTAAQKVFEEAAALGNPDAQMGLGLLYATGTTVASSQAEALLYYTFGAFGGSPWAQMALGYRCEGLSTVLCCLKFGLNSI